MPDVPVTAAPVAIPAAPAPSAVDLAVTAHDPVAYKAARRAETLTPTPSAAPSAAEPAVQVASTDALPKPASEPAKAKGADARVQELLADRAAERLRAERAERELETLRSQPKETPKAASSPAAALDAEPDPTNATKYPDGQFDRAFLKDQARWEARQEFAQQQQQVTAQRAAESRAKALDARDDTYRQRIQQATATDPTFVDRISADVKALRPFDDLKPGEVANGYNALAEELLSSPIPVPLMEHFTAHPDDLHRLAKLHPREFLREFGKLEARLDVAAPTPKPITSAPAPPTALTTGSTNTTDPVEAALKSGDFPAYQQAKRRRERAALGL